MGGELPTKPAFLRDSLRFSSGLTDVPLNEWCKYPRLDLKLRRVNGCVLAAIGHEFQTREDQRGRKPQDHADFGYEMPNLVSEKFRTTSITVRPLRASDF